MILICFVSTALECEECRGTLTPCDLLATIAPSSTRCCVTVLSTEEAGGLSGAGRSHYILRCIKVAALVWFDTQAKKENRKSHMIFELGLNVASWENR